MIKQIVLDVLKENEEKDKDAKVVETCRFRRTKKEIAQLVEAKIQAVSIDRDEVDTIITKLLKRLHEIEHGACEQITGKPMNDYVLNRTNAINKAINDICNLPIEEGDK